MTPLIQIQCPPLSALDGGRLGWGDQVRLHIRLSAGRSLDEGQRVLEGWSSVIGRHLANGNVQMAGATRHEGPLDRRGVRVVHAQCELDQVGILGQTVTSGGVCGKPTETWVQEFYPGVGLTRLGGKQPANIPSRNPKGSKKGYRQVGHILAHALPGFENVFG